jgi:hypothetical protein
MMALQRGNRGCIAYADAAEPRDEAEKPETCSSDDRNSEPYQRQFSGRNRAKLTYLTARRHVSAVRCGRENAQFCALFARFIEKQEMSED